MSIGKNIKKYREQLGYTQEQLANILNISNSNISKYESNALEPNIEMLRKLSEALNISIDTLLNVSTFDISSINILNVLKEQKDIGLKGNIYHKTMIAFTYNTNHMEGSTISEEQTRYIFETNTLISDQSVININDITETTNHFKLIDYMIDHAKDNLTEELIKEFHNILKSNTIDSEKDWFNVGEYKQIQNFAGDTKTSSPKDVPNKMKKLLDWYNSLEKVTFEDIVEFHYRFECIHPFQDGNGRIGRIIAFKECLKNNIVPFIILDENKAFYYRGLKEYSKEKGYLLDTCLDAQDFYASMIEFFLKR